MRVVIAEDSVIVREGLVRILTDEGFDVHAVSGPDDLLRHVLENPPDIAIVDVRMPPTHTDESIRAAIEIRRHAHGTPVLLFSQYVETTRAIELLQSGPAGFGYLLKDRVLDVDEFVAAVRRVAGGGTAIDPLIVSALVGVGQPPGRLESLSSRELEVLQHGGGPHQQRDSDEALRRTKDRRDPRVGRVHQAEAPTHRRRASPSAGGAGLSSPGCMTLAHGKYNYDGEPQDDPRISRGRTCLGYRDIRDGV